MKQGCGGCNPSEGMGCKNDTKCKNEYLLAIAFLY